MVKNIEKVASRSIVAGGALLLAVAAAPSATAHITANPDTTAGGAYALVSFGVSHGCDGSPTTEVRISIPEGINSVTPTVNRGWDLEKVTEELAEPSIDSHGNEVTERVSEVVYTADDPLPADFRDVFDLSVKLPEEMAGETLYFPTIQSCEKGEAAWIQIPAEGQDADELDMPSPELTLSAATSTEDAEESQLAEVADNDQNAFTGWSIAALIVGALALVVSLAALLRGGRRE
ncbi:YcnI family copper-binding membrane protein [Corynebacterium casei]|uniref:YcnI family copper-binding membrane protein n=1 Tax=Corynebacterium casei TaxID=160386 RepID=UPI000BF0EC00|nr:YcnI family protein [Corynebacterium casei]MDN5834409.1 YcnI family protein [Brevibacterium sp.]